MTTSSSAEAANTVILRACAALQPADWDGHEDVIRAVDAPGWDAISAMALRHGVAGLVARGFEWAHQRTGIRVPILHRLAEWRHGQLLQLLKYRSTVRQVAEGLSARGIRFVVYKGFILAEEVYGDLSLRAFGDCDILVHPSELRDAYAVLQEFGYSLAYDNSLDEVIARDGHAAALKNRDGAAAIDLHWALEGGELRPDDFRHYLAPLPAGRSTRSISGLANVA